MSDLVQTEKRIDLREAKELAQRLKDVHEQTKEDGGMPILVNAAEQITDLVNRIETFSKWFE